jgi:hypothetical protein
LNIGEAIVGQMHLIATLPQMEIERQTAEEVKAAPNAGNENRAAVREMIENREVERRHGCSDPLAKTRLLV